jgi:hypothetical protein
MAVLSGTPFLAISSNSWKIEALIADIGLDPSRLTSPTDLTPGLLEGRDWSYSETEHAAIAAALTRWRATGAALFDAVRALTPDPPT